MKRHPLYQKIVNSLIFFAYRQIKQSTSQGARQLYIRIFYCFMKCCMNSTVKTFILCEVHRNVCLSQHLVGCVQLDMTVIVGI